MVLPICLLQLLMLQLQAAQRVVAIYVQPSVVFETWIKAVLWTCTRNCTWIRPPFADQPALTMLRGALVMLIKQ